MLCTPTALRPPSVPGRWAGRLHACCVLRAACCVLRAACCVLRACCVLLRFAAPLSDCLRCGLILCRQLRMHPRGRNGNGTDLSVFLDSHTDMWAPRAKYTLTLVNEADASKSRSHGQSQ
jgi:hypothetical protein